MERIRLKMGFNVRWYKYISDEMEKISRINGRSYRSYYFANGKFRLRGGYYYKLIGKKQ